MDKATWELFSAFVVPEGRLNSVVVDYLSKNNQGELLRLAETLASQKTPWDGRPPIPAYVRVSVLSLRT